MHEIILSAEIEKKLREIETKILSIVNFKDFFEVLLNEIKEKFTIPFAWITLIGENDITTLIQAEGTCDDLENQMTIIGREIFLNLIGTTSKPLLVKDDLKAYYPLFPPKSSYFIKSLAISPISLDGTVIGSLNLADFTTMRFHHRTYAQFLELLAIKTSISLSKVTAHEKINALTFQDPTTGLLNRNVMETILEREFRRNQRYANDLSVVLIDLDDTHRELDSFGDDWGDNLFKHAADIIVQMSRNSDVISRFDTGKLSIIMPETKAENALNLIGRIQRNLKEHPLRIKGQLVSPSMDFGVASTENGDISNSPALLKRAHENLERAKNARKENQHQDTGPNIRSKVIQLPLGKKELK